MNEVSKQKEKLDGHEKLLHEGSAARTRPTSVYEIMLRRKRKESLENVKEETVGAAQIVGNDPVEKASDHHESGKGHDRSKKASREERVKNSLRKKEDTSSSSREERLIKSNKEDPVGAAPLLGNDLVEKVSDYHESEKGYDESKNLSCEEHVKENSRKNEDASSSSREEKLEELKKEDPVGLPQLLSNDVVENVSDFYESEKGYNRSEKLSDEERVKENSRKNEDASSSSREEKLEEPKKEDPVGAAKLLGNDLVENVSDCHESEKGYDRSEILRHEERLKGSSRKKEEAISRSREEIKDNPMKEDPVGAAQLLGKDLVEKVSDSHASEKEHDKKERHEEHVKDSLRKKEDATSCSREERLDKPMKDDSVEAAQLLDKDPVEKVSDNHASEKRHDRSKKVRREENVKDSSKKKEDAISSSREEKQMKEDPSGAAQLLGKDPVEKVSDYHESGKRYDRSEKMRREERVKDSLRKKEEAVSSSRDERQDKPKRKEEGRVKDSSRKKEEAVSSSRDERQDKPKKEDEERVKDSLIKKNEAISSSREERQDKRKREEETSANRRRKAEGERSTAEKKSVEEHMKDRRRNKEETNSSCREERPDKKMKKEDLTANRKMRVEGESRSIEIKTMTDRDGVGGDTKMKEKGEKLAAKTTEKEIYSQETGHEQDKSALENLPGSRKRLKSLVVTDIPRDENNMKPDNGNKRINQNGDHKKNRESNVSKRHDPGKVNNVEGSDRREKREQPKSHQRDSREKRRRSRSRDHGHDRRKRSSPLPRTEKATSRHTRDHEKRSENAVKDKPEKHHSNDNENKDVSTVHNKCRRYSASKSELGGYSPRKRREDTSAKAASPPNLSSEKKSAKWDLTPTVPASMFSSSVFSGLQAAAQTTYPTIGDASLTFLKPLMEVPFRTAPARQITSVDSVQLTESTRRMRRLYAENVPDSASERSLIECFNRYMLSSGSNHIKGSEPCISCIINKEKSQALVEFLTPQDASAALSLDGCSFAGSNLKIRRPKDYVDTTSGELEKKEPATSAVCNNVEDSSNKIFIGGFPKAISPEMLMEIVSVFGPLKAYRYVIHNDLNQRCAFVEYTDGSVTLKACAGLNGMKLGGSVITAVCALPDASSVTVNENHPPFYGIPEHAKPLLGKPKHILKLKNVVDPEDLPSLSETELKEILEDVRLECARFGAIKSINIVEHQSKDDTGPETDALLNPESTDSKEMNASVFQEKDEGSTKAVDITDNKDPAEVVKPDNTATGEDKLHEPCSDTTVETSNKANEDLHSNEQDHSEKIVEESAQDKAEHPHEEVGSVRAIKTRWDTGDKIEEEKQDPKDVFEPGCIFIEYGRPEAARDAAHSLHGRLYDNRVVKAEYVSKELYQIRFPSG